MKTNAKIKCSIKMIGAASVFLGAILSGESQAQFVSADFDGDGLQDLVFGVAYEDFSGLVNPGAVKVVYGRQIPGRINATEYIHQHRAGTLGLNLEDEAESYDTFGSAVDVGDFNGDGYDDLAISTRNEKVNGVNLAGLVNIVYGSSDGLTEENNHTLDLQKVRNGQYTHERVYFGKAITVGDHNGDGIDDLTVGLYATKPIDDNDDSLHGGGIITFYGDEMNGLKDAEMSPQTRVRIRFWSPTMQYNDYGGRLTSGDFNGDGIDDVAVGAILEDLTLSGDDILIKNAGSVQIIYGVEDWTTTFTLAPIIIPLRKDVDGNFGYAMESADFNHDGRDELVISAPGSGIGGASKSGAVVVAKFQRNGSITQTWYYQSQSRFSGTSVANDKFGHALTIADFNNDGNKDIAIGVPFKDKNSFWSFQRINNYGEVLVMYSNRWGGFSYSETWHQDSSGVADFREDNDYFGLSLNAVDFNRDGISDLMAGIPYEDVGSIANTGAVQLIWGNSSGLTANIGTPMYTQNTFYGAGFGVGYATQENEAYDYFGNVLP